MADEYKERALRAESRLEEISSAIGGHHEESDMREIDQLRVQVLALKQERDRWYKAAHDGIDAANDAAERELTSVRESERRLRERVETCFNLCQGLERNSTEESDNYWEMAEDLMVEHAEATGQKLIRTEALTDDPPGQEGENG